MSDEISRDVIIKMLERRETSLRKKATQNPEASDKYLYAARQISVIIDDIHVGVAGIALLSMTT